MTHRILQVVVYMIGLFALAVILKGCALNPTVPSAVNVAVATPCDAPVPDKPTFPADTLTGKEDIFTIGKTLWADKLARHAYEIKLRTALEGCVGK